MAHKSSKSRFKPTPTRGALNWKSLSPGATKKSGKGVELGHKGVAGSKMLEGFPTYVRSDNEHVIENKNGAQIVIGRDRPGSRISGYGAEHQSARIDLVVGRMAMDNIGAVNENGEQLFVDNSFEKDAARIYISQKANIDHYFDLKPGKVGMSKTRSAVGIKADAVRIIGREGIKLVTRPEPLNSMGGKIERVGGIDLIAGNDDRDLQPMIKGTNMMKAFSSLVTWVGKLNGIIDGILLEQSQLNTALALHTHIGTGAGPTGPIAVKTFPSIELGIATKVAINHFLHGSLALQMHRMNGVMLDYNHTKPFGREYICSRYNNTN